ncbi:MAG: cytochrome c biogenesis protein CcsA [Planctomycetes bacterium]|nr:cytochrome c biogenesis protein CcsA [Planctomycetota bacterium]
MTELPALELVVFTLVILLNFSAALIACLQLRPGGDKFKLTLNILLSLALIGSAKILVLRALAIKAFPLTGLFESMLLLTIALAVMYLILGKTIRQVWFGSVITWINAILIILTALIAQPASVPLELARQPWAIAHALAMIFGAAMILLAAVTAYLYLLGIRRLKNKQIAKVIGIVPNIQTLERINLFSLQTAFVLVTLGSVSGIVGAWLGREMLDTNFARWLFDSKILGVLITWIILLVVLLLHSLKIIKGKRTAPTTIIAFVWILFSLVGCSILCQTKHDFTFPGSLPPTESREVDK